MIKAFKELLELDISKYIEKKPTFKYDKAANKMVKTDKELDYLSWVNCLSLLYENGAEKVTYDTIKNDTGHSLYLCNGQFPEIRVYVEIDGDRREMTFPLIDGTNDIKMEKLAQSDIHNAMQRAFVKCVAINWGMGLSLWKKEEIPETVKEEMSLHESLTRKTNAAARKLGGAAALQKRTSLSEAKIREVLLSVKVLETALDGVLNDNK